MRFRFKHPAPSLPPLVRYHTVFLLLHDKLLHSQPTPSSHLTGSPGNAVWAGLPEVLVLLCLPLVAYTFYVIQVIGRVISLWLRDFGARCLLDACRSHLQVVHFIMPARAPLVQLSKREPVYHKVIMGGASCYFCHIPLAGGNKPKFFSLSSLFQGVSTKRREPRTHGNSDIHKLLQHTSSGHHHIQLRCLPSTDLAEEVHQSRAGASPGFLLWPNACTINHQALLLYLLDASWSHSFLHCGAAAAPACLPPFSGFYHQPQLHCSNEDHSVSTCDDYNVSLYPVL